MDWAKIIHDLFFDYTLRNVALGSGMLGIVGGALGAFAVLRKQSLVGDAISHAALPGIVLAFLLTRSKAPLPLMLGAAAAGWVATLLIMRIVGSTRIKFDSALGFTLSVFFGFGLMLLTFVQRQPDARQAGLDKFLFGQAATLVAQDVLAMTALGGLALALLVIFWKEFKLLSFDMEFASSLGLPVHALEILLTSLIVLAIVVGLQAVGVVLMSAMLIAPAAAARQWTDRLGVMVTLSAFFGALAGVSGAVISSTLPRLPTGPMIVVIAMGIVIISLLFAPDRGLIWNWVRTQTSRRRLNEEAVLMDLYALASQHPDLHHAHSISALQIMTSRSGVTRSLESLAARGLIQSAGDGQWALTAQGVAEARRRNQILPGDSADHLGQASLDTMEAGR
jgi:manganese/zinc/iron transport system permease protein